MNAIRKSLQFSLEISIVLFTLANLGLSFELKLHLFDHYDENKTTIAPTLNIAELAIFGDLSANPVYISSSELASHSFSRCFDGDAFTFCSTDNESDKNPQLTIQVKMSSFHRVEILNRIDCCWDRIRDFAFSVIDDSGDIVYSYHFNSTDTRFRYAFDFKTTKSIDSVEVPLEERGYALAQDNDMTSMALTVSEGVIPRYSQCRQDEWVVAFLNEKRNGIFVDIGANDGVTFSNSYLLETSYGWRGLLIEPLRKHMQSLYQHRSSHILNACVYNETSLQKFMEVESSPEWKQKHKFGEDMLSGVATVWNKLGELLPHRETAVPCFNINEVFRAFNLTHIDYLSIDAEGAELMIAQSIDWSVIDADVISIEFGYNDDVARSMMSYFINVVGYTTYVQLEHDFVFF